ncbi:hypothetical protein DY000_02051147 [Brassica cretica]|uniref:DNA topoisomerase (ATP-hydrolyzing) n=1 Tax=Brassica cretica TaxID=69181 RepID=A0ABQ7EUR3_BRACR|nr:hypothetical protein DY000_02051147 [Brassica cretica]
MAGNTEGREVLPDKLEDARQAGGKNSNRCTLILTEGDSSKALAMSGLTSDMRDFYGVYPITGKVLNVRKASPAQINRNKFIQDLTKILKLELQKEYTDTSSLRYGRVILMTDQVTHETKEAETFSSLREFKEWKEKDKAHATEWSVKFYKGLGSSTVEEGMLYFNQIDIHVREFVWEGDADGEAINIAFGGDPEKRKEWIRNNNQVDSLPGPRGNKITYKEFVNNELVLFTIANLQRSIPTMFDGLKSGERKIIFTAFKIDLTELTPLDVFSSLVSQHSAYHHSRKCISNVIIRMAQDFIGRNNVNLFEPSGQFGTSASGGKDAANERYLHTKLKPVAWVLFPKADDDLLEYNLEYGRKLEPTRYFPIIPLVLLNGAKGIGSGFSTFIPQYNPRDVIANIRRGIKCEEMEPMVPWYRDFEGEIKKTGEGVYTSYGKCHDVNDNTVQISVLPIGLWTDDYKKILHALKANNGDPLIEDVSIHNDGSSMVFNVILSKKHKKEARREGYLKKFKLEKNITTTNMHLLMGGLIKKYHSPEEIIKDFYPHRLELYVKRKGKTALALTSEIVKLQRKIQFLKDVNRGVILVVGRLESEIIKELKSGDEKFLELSLTMDQCIELEKELAEKNQEVGHLNSSSAESMYEEDLKKFESMLSESEDLNSRKRGMMAMSCQRTVKPKKTQ